MLRNRNKFFSMLVLAAVVFTALVSQAVLAEGNVTAIVAAGTNYVPKGTWVWVASRFPEAAAAETWSLSGARTAGKGEWSYTGKIYQNCQWRTWTLRAGYVWHSATGYEVSSGRRLRVTLRKP